MHEIWQLSRDNKFNIEEWRKFFEQEDLLPIISQKKFLQELGYDFGLKHEIIDTPQELASFCKKYLRNLNLNFGCFDFIVTPEDKYIFLECNPNGQWGWIEDECKIPMSEALIDCLMNRLEV